MRFSIRGVAHAAFLCAAILGGLFVAALVIWRIAPPVSTLMIARKMLFQPVKRHWVDLENISPALVTAVLTSEDARFCHHAGVDWGALNEVLAQSDEDGPSRGASTIPMQVIKNLFLWPGRSALRKGLEIPMALTLDAVWPKRRILEVYLNVAEWGDGLFGVDAAAWAYFHKQASALNAHEASLLAAALPNPRLRNPARPGRGYALLAQRLAARAIRAAAPLDCLGGR